MRGARRHGSRRPVWTCAAPATGATFPATKGDDGASEFRVVQHLQRRRSVQYVESDGRSINLLAMRPWKEENSIERLALGA